MLRLLLLFATAVDLPAAEATALKFNFGTENSRVGQVAVSASDLYSKPRGYGFELGEVVKAGARGVTSEAPFHFTATVPHEGNYRVTTHFVGPVDVTVKAELRRLMTDRIQLAAGEHADRSFIVNTRTPQIAAHNDVATGIVALKAPRESTMEAWAWDEAITLEFCGLRPGVAAIEIEPVDEPTIFLLGDSTVCDQPKEPYASWGQMLTRFFKAEVAIANHAESGETYRDSIGRRRLDKIVSLLRPGDWVIMQFGHNDQKQIPAGTGGPFTTYREEIRKHIDAIRAHGGTPMIVSPMERGNFSAEGKLMPSLTDYATAARQSAEESQVAFVDLNAMSIRFYEALGAEKVQRLFANPAGKDFTHHNNYGAYELAQCVVQAIREQKLPLAKFIVDDFQGFDPAHPDEIDAVSIAPSGDFTNQRPLGD